METRKNLYSLGCLWIDNSRRLGLRPNINQFLILVLVNAFVGAMIGLEQTVVPLIGKNEFGIESIYIIGFICKKHGLV